MIEFPNYYEYLLGYFDRKKDSGFNNSLLLVYGVSRDIMGKVAKYEWFTKHILRHSVMRGTDIELPKVFGFTLSDRNKTPYDIAINFIEFLKGEKYEESPSEDEIKALLSKCLINHIKSTNVILPFKIIEDGNNEITYQIIEDFINQYWFPMLKEISEDSEISKTDYSLVLVLLVEERLKLGDRKTISKEDLVSGDSTFFGQYNLINSSLTIENKVKIKVDKVGYTNEINTWITKPKSFFKYHNYRTICDGWICQKEAYLPECRTMEGLFEKITPEVFDNKLTFPELLNLFKP
ncbi:MAG: hypothetical protein MUE81_22380 [Thermoflexibacter sp.]|nr:hypothetical protein [Thermoflexibacter sp.]